MYSVKNMLTVEEEIAQIDCIFKQLLLLVHQEYYSLLDEEENPTDEEWFEEVEERVFTFKLQVLKRLRNAEMERANTSTISYKIFETNFSFHVNHEIANHIIKVLIANHGNSLIPILRDSFASTNKSFILEEGLSTRLSFYEV